MAGSCPPSYRRLSRKISCCPSSAGSLAAFAGISAARRSCTAVGLGGGHARRRLSRGISCCPSSAAHGRVSGGILWDISCSAAVHGGGSWRRSRAAPAFTRDIMLPFGGRARQGLGGGISSGPCSPPLFSFAVAYDISLPSNLKCISSLIV